MFFGGEVVEQAVRPVVVVPVDVVRGQGLDVGEGAQWTGPEWCPGGDGLVLIQPDGRFRGRVVVGITDRPNRGQ